MIITRLAGGIGNQMFHYAAARRCQKTRSERIVLDTFHLRPLEADIEKIVQRPYALDIFSKLQATPIDPHLSRLLYDGDFVSRLRRKLFNVQTHVVRQEFLEAVSIPPRRARHLWLLGNFQSEDYFVEIRDQLLIDFSFPLMDASNESIRTRISESSEALAIHLRRGDYHSTRNVQVFNSVTLDYYHQSIAKLTRHVPVGSLKAFVFSDDIPWAREHFNPPGLRMEYIEGNDGASSWKDMLLMSCCRHHIIANSSFSWWGAWLSKPGGVNLAPRHWFRPDTYPYNIDHIVPKGWNIVDYALH